MTLDRMALLSQLNGDAAKMDRVFCRLNGEGEAPQGLKPGFDLQSFIAALKRCATQKRR